MARMDSPLYVQYPATQQLSFVPVSMYAQVYPTSPVPTQAQASPYLLRSPAQYGIQTASPRQFQLSAFDRSSVEVYSEDEFSSSASSTSSQMPPAQEPEYHHLTATTVAAPYTVDPAVARAVPWAKEEPVEYTTVSPAVLAARLPDVRYSSPQAHYQTYCEPAELGPPDMPSYYDSDALSQEMTMSPYASQETPLPSVVHNFSHSPRLASRLVAHEHSVSPRVTSRAIEPMHLQYPPSPHDPPKQFVSLQDVSPSPTVSPDQVYSTLPTGSPAVSHIVARTATPCSVAGGDRTATQIEAPTPKTSRKRRRPSPDEDDFHPPSDSGESEKDDSDDEYRPSRDNARNVRRRVSIRSAPREQSPVEPERPRLAPPVPVPNLTKKSRGRRVPTNATLVSSDGIEKTSRSYKCKVPGCNKYFQRGEHLKRHIRSIHTNEKPHKCPYRSCGKDFSRHDNLRQHMRVHRNERLNSEETSGSA